MKYRALRAGEWPAGTFWTPDEQKDVEASGLVPIWLVPLLEDPADVPSLAPPPVRATEDEQKPEPDAD